MPKVTNTEKNGIRCRQCGYVYPWPAEKPAAGFACPLCRGNFGTENVGPVYPLAALGAALPPGIPPLPPPPPPPPAVYVTQAARELADRYRLAAEKIPGTGNNGAVTKADVMLVLGELVGAPEILAAIERETRAEDDPQGAGIPIL